MSTKTFECAECEGDYDISIRFEVTFTDEDVGYYCPDCISTLFIDCAEDIVSIVKEVL